MTSKDGPASGQKIEQLLCSDLLRWSVYDQQGRQAQLDELVVELGGEGYPPISALVLMRDRKRVALPWAEVRAVEHEARRLDVADLEAATPFDQASAAGRALLRRDILDAMIVVVPERAVALASDLWLGEDAGQLWLRGVEIGVLPLVRRLSRGLLGRKHASWVDWIDVEFLRGEPQEQCRLQSYHSPTLQLQPAEIAQLLDALPYLQGAELVSLLPSAVAADVLEVTSPERQLQIVEELGDQAAAEVLGLMSPDTAADLVSRLDPELAQHYLAHMSEQSQARVTELLCYAADTAGGIMVNDMVVLPAGLTVAEARQLLKQRAREPDFIYYLYVIDDEASGKLRGVLTVRDLLLADDGQLLDEIMQSQLTLLAPDLAAEAAARRVAESSLAALPVVDDQGRLVGAVTADAAVAQLAPPAWRLQAPRIFS